jgi:MFS family permease
MSAPAFAEGEGHGHGPPPSSSYDPGLLVWGGLSLAGVLAVLVLFRWMLAGTTLAEDPRRGGQVGYATAVRQFSRNARLFLGYSVLAELGSGIWAVMFNLYLLRVGFPITFIGTFWLVNMLAHGAGSLPAGLIADRFGRRRAFFIATFFAIVAQGGLLFSQEPAAILVLAAVAGFGEAFHGVTGPPFMMENSEPGERPHLFSLNACFLQFSRFAGSLSGGILPLFWAGIVGVPAVDPTAVRWALVTGLPLTLLALTPLIFMREKPVQLVESFKDLVTFRGVVHLDIILRFTWLSLATGAAFGLTIRFFNVFFQEARQASDPEVGTVLALGSIAGAGAILIAPVLAQHWGKAKSVFLTQALSVPFLVLMAAVPSLFAVTTIFLVRGALYSIAGPLRNQLAMEFIDPRERGTTAGLTHTTFDLGGALGAGMAGLLVLDGDFTFAFTAAAVLILVPSVLYYVYFDAMETRAREGAAVLRSAVPVGRG